MKLRNFLIVLFAVLMVFAFASCKNEPAEQKPQPKPQPQIPDYYQIEVTEGVDKDYWNRDKIKIEWEEEVNAGDTISLKYRSERDVYQWDIRDGSLKWVYESSKGSFTDPVKGEDGWWTLTYTFANDINGAAVDSNERFGVYFRGNYVSTDLFEIKDITLNGEPLEITQDNIKSYAVLNGTDENPIVEHDWSVKNWSVLFATGTVGEVDKTPLAEKVVDGGLVTGAPVAKEGYTLSIYTDAARTIPFDATQPITEAKIFYYSYVGVPRTLTFVLNGGAFEEGAEVPETVPNGDMLPEIPEPVLATKAFKAWYKDAELTTPWEATDAVTGDLTLYAAYGDPVTVTFQANNGEEPTTKIVAQGNPVKVPEIPVNGSKMFLGWYTDDGVFENQYVFGTPVEADITIYAAWANTTDVTLNLNYEGAPAATSFKAALDVVLAEDDENLVVKRSGFDFAGWYDEATCETEHDFTVAVTGSFTLYAKWTVAKIGQLTATKGITDKKSSYEKVQFNFDLRDILGETGGVQSGDTITLKFRTSRDFYDYDIRTNKKVMQSGAAAEVDVRWVYEGFRGTLADPVLGEDGWYTFTYTFGDSYYTSKTAPNYTTDQYYNVGVNFRGYLIKGDIFEIKDVTYTRGETTYDIPMKSSYNAASFFEYAEVEYHEWTAAKTYAVIYNASSDDSYPLTEAVVSGAAAKGLAEDGYIFSYFTDSAKTTPFDLTTAISADTKVYYTKTEITDYVLTATAANDRFQFKWDDLAIKAGDVITFKYQSEKAITSHTTRSITPSEKFVDGAALTGEPTDGWYTFSYTIPDGKEATGLGIALFVEGGAAVDDVLKIKDITLNETKLYLYQANAWAGCSPTIVAE